MKKSELNILVVEDDPTLRQALCRGLEKEGYRVHMATGYHSAREIFDSHEVHGLIIDCMLPQKNGVDMAYEFQSEAPEPLKIIFTSGVFKDPNYSQTALTKTKAIDFFLKPFDLEKLMNTLNKAFEEDTQTSNNSLTGLIEAQELQKDEVKETLSTARSINGFDLPYVYKLLVKFKMSGDLKVNYSEKDAAVISFSKGLIYDIHYPDTQSYFGILLAELGFISPEELQKGLELKNNKPIGETLVDSAVLSPHAIEVVRIEQMIIRLSKTIKETSVEVIFTPKDCEVPTSYINSYRISQLIIEWVECKLTTDWLRSFTTSWLTKALVKGDSYSDLTNFKFISYVENEYEKLEQIDGKITLGEFLDSSVNEENALKTIYILLLNRVLSFKPSKKKIDYRSQINRLQKLKDSMVGKNHFEIFNVERLASSSEINRTYIKLAKTLHPDKIEPSAPPELKKLTTEVFALITEAHRVLSNEEEKARYVNLIDRGSAEELLQAESLFEQSYRLLKNGRYGEAREGLQKLLNMKSHKSDAAIYLIWATIKENKKGQNIHELIQHTNHLISKVPHEDRHSPHYFYAKALVCSLREDYQKAYTFLKHTLALEPEFTEAKKELMLINNAYKKSQKTSITHLLAAMASLFKKKKTG